MNIESLFNPSTPIGALIIGVLVSFISGFFTGKTYEKKRWLISNSKISGDGNTVIQNSNIK